MKPKSIMLAKGVIGLAGLGALAMCVILLPELAREDAAQHPDSAYAVYPFLIGAYAMAIPFFLALYQALKLLGHITQGRAFAPESIEALKRIKYCAIAVAALIGATVIAGIAVVRSADPAEDITPIVALGFVGVLTASVIATSVAILQKLWQSAVAIKSENDLTV